MPQTSSPRSHASAALHGDAANASRFGLIATDIFAAAIVAALNVAMAVSFAALLFQGDLKDGFATGLWSLLMSMVVIGVVVSLMTSLPPLSAGPDTPVMAVATLLASAASSQILTLGGNLDVAIRHALLAFSLMTLVSGVVVYMIGALRWGQFLRFVPYPVVAGFLAATGWLIIVSSHKVATGMPLTFDDFGGTMSVQATPKLAVAIVFAAGLLMARGRIKASYLIPVAFFGAALTVDLVLWSGDSNWKNAGWFIGGTQNLKPWYPLAAASSSDLDWTVLARTLPELATCIIVGIISLVVKISSIEVSRSAAADIDQELRANGAANILAAPLGAVAGSVLIGPSKVFLDAGARTRFAGIAAAGIIALVIIAGVDFSSVVPTPILAGLLLLLGYGMLTDALKGAFKQRSWVEFVLALAIAFVCVRFGYIAGVVAGFVCACLAFALSYGRIGVVRRQLTRASFTGDVERSPETERLLRQEGDAIQIYWLSGYIFFGSSEGLFERLRRSIEANDATPVRYVVLDFTDVSGIDSSAVMSVIKLKNICDKRSVTLVFSALAPLARAAFDSAGIFGEGKRHRAFGNRNEALDWSEEQLLSNLRSFAQVSAVQDFELWLSRELGGDVRPEQALQYFERREHKDGDILYQQGDPADSIDFIASGALAILVDDGRGGQRRIRRSTRQTVLGEMGFFRATPRAATITAEGPAVIYTISRANLDRMQREHADIYEAFLHSIIRTLSDRVELAHKEVAALT